MTIVAGVIGKVAVDVACVALRGVMPIEAKIRLMLKCSRFPGGLSVTLAAHFVELSVQSIAWLFVAGATLFLQSWFEQVMGELTDGAKGFHSLMVTMAGHAIVFDQLLMKRDVFLLP